MSYKNYSGRKEWDYFDLKSKCKHKGRKKHRNKTKRIISISNIAINAKRMRDNPTKAELFIKRILIEMNVEFINQHIIEYRILDFYLPKQRVAIEADGLQHYTPEGIINDEKRDREIHLNDPRIRIIRYPNRYILGVKKFKDDLALEIYKIAKN